jgi:hypothetical protein
MLHNVPQGIRRLSRNVVLNHPNSWACQVFRKVVDRAAPGQMGGLPTLGGLGVLSDEDEDEFHYDYLGEGYALQAEAFTPAQMMDRNDANNGAVPEIRFLIEPAAPSGMPGWFEVKERDVVYLVIADNGEDSVKIAYEVVVVETPVNISAMPVRYVMNRRADCDAINLAGA